MMIRSYTILNASLAMFVAFLSHYARAEAVDCEPDPGTNMLIEYSDSISCVFEGESDLDVYRFVGNAGDRPFISLVSPNGRIILTDPSGTELKDSTFLATARIDSVTLTEDGIHTITAQAHPNADNWDYILELPCLAGKCSNPPVPQTLGYTAVEPCRIVDTRYGIGGEMVAGEARHFHTYGDVSDQNSAGGGAPASYPTECPFALGEHAAAHLNVVVLPRGSNGVKGTVKVWPFTKTKPVSPWIWYKKSGSLKIANAGTVKVHSSDGDTPDISAWTSRDIHLIIDVQGYYNE
jgi:hypothetical protein